MSKVHLINANSMYIPLEDESVHLAVCSPPYHGLRSYSVSEDNKSQEIGTEILHDCGGWCTGDFCGECYVCRTIQWTDEVWRILRNDGTFWLNIADSYAGSGGAGGDCNEGGLRDGQPKWKNRNKSLPAKNLYGIPWRVALALQARGWILRSDIIWYAKNKMPESAKDRCTRTHEYIFMLTKSKTYFFDDFAIKEENANPYRINYAPGKRAYSDGNTVVDSDNRARRNDGFEKYANGAMCDGRNKRTVWEINNKPHKGTHYAVFPQELPEICIKAGTSEYGCCSAKIKKLKLKNNLSDEQMQKIKPFLQRKGLI